MYIQIQLKLEDGIYTYKYKYVQIYTNICKCIQIYTNIYKYIQIDTNMHDFFEAGIKYFTHIKDCT